MEFSVLIYHIKQLKKKLLGMNSSEKYICFLYNRQYSKPENATSLQVDESFGHEDSNFLIINENISSFFV